MKYLKDYKELGTCIRGNRVAYFTGSQVGGVSADSKVFKSNGQICLPTSEETNNITWIAFE